MQNPAAPSLVPDSSPSPVPKLSFGLPVFNGERSLERLLDSIQAQTFGDFELVISDNLSTDGTARICMERARNDARIRFHRQPENRGIVANFNHVLALSRGEYFRWIGADDWLEPTYAARCCARLDQHPDAIGVTSFQAFWGPNGERHYKEYSGPRIESLLAHERFALCLSLLHDDYQFFDPMYAMHRREVFTRTRGLQPVLQGDRLLAAELSLLGPYTHVPECLANRNLPPPDRSDLEYLRPPGAPALDGRPERVIASLYELIQELPLTRLQRIHCYVATLDYYLKEFNAARIAPIRARVGNRLRDWGISPGPPTAR